MTKANKFLDKEAFCVSGQWFAKIRFYPRHTKIFSIPVLTIVKEDKND